MRNHFPASLNIDDFCTVNRRTLLRGLGAVALLTATGSLFRGGVWASPVFAAYPFSLGVAADDPAPDGFVMATSISCGGAGFDTNDSFQTLLAQDPHIKFFNNQRGYVRHAVTPDRWQADFQVLDWVSGHDGHISTRKSFVIEHGKSGLTDV